MPTPTSVSTTEYLAARLGAEHRALARAWLDRLDQLLDVDKRDVFPSHQLLDHIPDLIREIARYLREPADYEIAANTSVMAKADELGLLRFSQQASVHQLLREYQLLAEILDDFFVREVAALGAGADAAAALTAAAHAQQAVRELERKTVDAFIRRYTETIERQHAQLRGFGRLVSHEIRQPLGVLEVLARLIPPGQEASGKRLADALQRNVTRLGDVAAKLERLARLARRDDPSPNDQSVDLGAISRDVAGQLTDMAEARGVRFGFDDDLPTLTADAGRVELVLMNLIANAVKYCDPDKPDRFVRVSVDRAGDGPRLRIEDNGLGIPQQQLQAVFDDFVRAHADRDDELGVHGLGLGLAIVRECMDAMGGTVLVESVDRRGTSFLLSWPPEAWQSEAKRGEPTRGTPIETAAAAGAGRAPEAP